MNVPVHYLTRTLDEWLGSLPASAADPDDAEILLVGGRKIDLNIYPRLKGIFKTGVGTDNLPFAEAEERGIRIALPGEATRQIIYRETADFACHLVLRCLYRNVGEFATWTKTPRQSLSSRQVLVVGTGRIGSIVRDSLSGFCRVSTFDTLSNSPDELRGLLAEADCVTLHIPLNEETRHFMNATRLAWMKDGSSLVNTARGSVIDDTALLDELRDGRLFAALDVFSEEPYRGELSELPASSVMLTPHVASTCQQFLEGTAADFLQFLETFGIGSEEPAAL